MLSRIVAAAAITPVALLVGPAVGNADPIWGNTTCGDATYAGCDVQAGRDEQPPVRSGRTPKPPPTRGGARPAATPIPPECHYTRSISQWAPPPGARQGAGAWHMYLCSGARQNESLTRPLVWVADAAPALPPSPEELAAQARDRLRLPSPQVATSPAGTQLVGLPTWLWIDRDQWTPQSATASVPGVSVTATAIPQSLRWSMGDGATVTCPGPGTPFPRGGDPAAASPDCGHRYVRSSLGLPGDVYRATATVTWTVSWSGAGTAGTYPGLTTQTTVSLPVAESQALNEQPQ